ncbi:MAG: zinc ribbon domain-containing protein [Oscillospiraceae bacterium]|nr:zinc ribbon domain-containing protein [Oscillospiraceae bacterium]
MGFLEKVGGFAERAGEKVKKGATGVADKSKLLAEKTKLRSQINSENSNINKAYTELGKKYFELFGHEPSEDFAEIVGRINNSNVHITELQQQLAALEVETTCPKCGAVIRKDQQFCQACGSKTESFVDVSAEDIEVVAEVEKAAEEQSAEEITSDDSDATEE